MSGSDREVKFGKAQVKFPWEMALGTSYMCISFNVVWTPPAWPTCILAAELYYKKKKGGLSAPTWNLEPRNLHSECRPPVTYSNLIEDGADAAAFETIRTVLDFFGLQCTWHHRLICPSILSPLLCITQTPTGVRPFKSTIPYAMVRRK